MKIPWKRWESNPGLLGEERERYLCAMLPPEFFLLRPCRTGNKALMPLRWLCLSWWKHWRRFHNFVRWWKCRSPSEVGFCIQGETSFDLNFLFPILHEDKKRRLKKNRLEMVLHHKVSKFFFARSSLRKVVWSDLPIKQKIYHYITIAIESPWNERVVKQT